MNKRFLTCLIFVLIFPVLAFSADAPQGVTLKISPDWGKTQCANKPGNGINLIWEGVTDNRADKSVGVVKTKKEETPVGFQGSVDDTIGTAVKTVLSNCGFNVETKKDAGAGVKVSVIVTEFFAGGKKSFLNRETDAKGAMTLHFMGNGATYDFNLSATKSDKRLTKNSITLLETVLTGLLESMVNQVSESPAVFAEVKKLAGK